MSEIPKILLVFRFNNDEFRQEMTDEYIQLRTEYRQTGVSKVKKDYDKNLQKEFELWLMEKKKQSQPS